MLISRIPLGPTQWNIDHRSGGNFAHWANASASLLVRGMLLLLSAGMITKCNLSTGIIPGGPL